MVKERFARRVAKERDAAILDSCIRGFNESGCFHTSLDDVIVDVGIGKGTLYRHYGSRDELFGAALLTHVGTLLAHCRAIWDTHQSDPNAAFRAVIGELARLNRHGAPISPATLARLGCSCRWLNPGHPTGNCEALDVAFIPFVRRCQDAGLFAQASDPSWIAATILALVGSAAVTSPGHLGAKKVMKAETSRPSRRRPRADDDVEDLVHRIVHVLQRAFG